MFKYISEILSKLSVGQRLLALVFLLLSITFISVGPKVIDSLTHDTEELKIKVENQRAEIQTLTQRVAQLNDQVIEGQMSCTNKFVQREQEILIMISSLEAEAQKTNGKITVLEDKRNENRFGGGDYQEPDGDQKVSMMRIQEPVVQTKTIIKTDNTNMLKMISKVKKDVNDHIPK
jgi:predicted RNase H-like nuclease (RuvC/YqgF family)